MPADRQHMQSQLSQRTAKNLKGLLCPQAISLPFNLSQTCLQKADARLLGSPLPAPAHGLELDS